MYEQAEPAPYCCRAEGDRIARGGGRRSDSAARFLPGICLCGGVFARWSHSTPEKGTTRR